MINVFGMEKLHLFNIAKYDEIYKGLKKDGDVTKASMVDPDVVKACKEYVVPYVMTLSGGYSKDAWNAQYESIRALIEENL